MVHRVLVGIATLTLCAGLGLAQEDKAASAPAASKPAATKPAASAASQPVAWGKPIKTNINPGKMIDYPNDTVNIRAYYVAPKGAGPFPGVVMVHDIFGLNAWNKQQADDLARQGYLVIAPDLYSRQRQELKDAKDGLDARQAWVAYEKMTDTQALSDLRAAVDYLAKDKLVGEETPIGTVGFDMGGIYAVMLASTDVRVKAAVNFYGRMMYADTSSRRPVSPVDMVFNLHAPLLSFYGTKDPQNPDTQVRELESRLARNPNRTPYEVIKYQDVGHGFVVETRKGYNKEACQDARNRTRDFLARYLRAEPPKPEE